MDGYYRGNPTVPGWYLLEFENNGSQCWAVFEVLHVKDEEDIDGWILMGHRGGDRYFPSSRSTHYVNDWGYVRGYIPLEELSPAFAYRIYLSTIRRAWSFDRWWVESGETERWDTAIYLLKQAAKLVSISQRTHHLPLNDVRPEIPPEIHKVRKTQFTRYLQMMLPKADQDEMRMEEQNRRTAILPLTVTVRLRNWRQAPDDYTYWDLLFIEEVLQAKRCRQKGLYIDQLEFQVEEFTLEDLSKWSHTEDRVIADLVPDFPPCLYEVLVGDEWCSKVYIETLRGLLG